MVRTVTTAEELRAVLEVERSDGARVGFVPTMGALHEGHASLVAAAARDTDTVVVSVFVNPLQFAPSEDLGAYPRSLERDVELAATAGAGVVFAPSEEEMYPGGRSAVLTTVAVPSLASVMEGASRPTHFAGVCTVVAKLFHLVGPCRAYFGEKDYQQLVILQRMAADLAYPVEVLGCPTRREPDGLAMSSRNAYLSASERSAAPVLIRALRAGASLVADGTSDAAALRSAMAEVVAGASEGELDYVEVADPATLAPLGVVSGPCRLFGAVRFGSARLIDNLAAAPGAGPAPTGPAPMGAVGT